MKLKTILLAGFSALILSACGGGGGGSSTTVTPGGGTGGGTGTGGGSSGPTWTAGKFDPSSTFKNLCETPRAGSFDQQGSTLYENHWLRSWSDETYLWYNEITDQNPASFTDPLAYFAQLKTTATTASGAPRDKFHFTYDTEVWEELTQSGSSAGYGARIVIENSSPPREAIVYYTAPNTPADNVDLSRGATILKIDGEDLINGANVDTLNGGLFPEPGETHTFEIQAIDEDEPRIISMTAENIVMPPVLLTSTLQTDDDNNVGYMVFNTFGTAIAEEALYNAINDFADQDIEDLIIDLRYNGGGYLAISSQLAYMIAGPSATNGKVFETTIFNDKHSTTNPVTGNLISPTPFYSTTLSGFSNLTDGLALPQLNLPRVYVLSTDGTCSASEALINALQGINVEVVLIGDTTCGKPYGFYATDNCGTTYFTIQFKGINDKGFGDYSDGFSPFESGSVAGEPVQGCLVADNLSSALGDESEPMLAAAMTHINTDSCPADAVSLGKANAMAKAGWDRPASLEMDDGSNPLSLFSDPKARARYQLERTKILTLPEGR